jgi:hypothetical protein
MSRSQAGLFRAQKCGCLLENRDPFIVGGNVLDDLEPVAQRVQEPRFDRNAPQQRLASRVDSNPRPAKRVFSDLRIS